MKKLKVSGQVESEEVIELRLVKNESGELVVEDAREDWSVVGFRIVDGKIKLIRYTSIEDENYSINKDGQIEEVEE